jgi:hypothetical protein
VICPYCSETAEVTNANALAAMIDPSRVNFDVPRLSKKVLYHITRPENVKTILRHGIRPPEDAIAVWLTDMPLLWMKVFRDEGKILDEAAVIEVQVPIDAYVRNLTEEYGDEGKFLDFDYDPFTRGIRGQIAYYGAIPKSWITAYYTAIIYDIDVKVKRSVKK